MRFRMRRHINIIMLFLDCFELREGRPRVLSQGALHQAVALDFGNFARMMLIESGVDPGSLELVHVLLQKQVFL
jgi:hypothetical protein